MSGKGNKMVKNLMYLDVIPLSLGWESYGEVMEVVIPKNTPIPVDWCETVNLNEPGEWSTRSNVSDQISVEV